jgi:hypothetical protein
MDMHIKDHAHLFESLPGVKMTHLHRKAAGLACGSSLDLDVLTGWRQDGT